MSKAFHAGLSNSTVSFDTTKKDKFRDEIKLTRIVLDKVIYQGRFDQLVLGRLQNTGGKTFAYECHPVRKL